MLFVGLAAAGAIGAYFANRRSAKAAEQQVDILSGQVAAAQTAAAEQQRIALEALAETRNAANAAKLSADTAALALEHSDRPWLSIAVRLAPKGVTFHAEQGLTVAAHFAVHNLGKSVATDVDIVTRVVRMGTEAAAQRELTARYTDDYRSPWGGSVFPSRDEQQAITQTIGIADLQTGWAGLGIQPDRPLKDRPFLVALIGCVVYRYQLSTRWHHTYFGYTIGIVPSDGGLVALDIENLAQAILVDLSLGLRAAD